MTNHATVDAFIQALEFYYQVTLEYSLAQTRAAWLANYLFHVPLHSRAVGAVSCDNALTLEAFKAEVCAAFPHIAADSIVVDQSAPNSQDRYFCAVVGDTGLDVVWLPDVGLCASSRP